MVTVFSRRNILVGVALVTLTTAARAEPSKIVTLEWAATEILLSLGIVPAGVADLAGYRQWVNIENDKLSAAVDVGGRQQPSLEALMRLKPDLIVTSALRHGAIAARLNEIAPTMLLDTRSEKSDFYRNMEAGLSTAGKAVGREPEARMEWASFEGRLSTVRAKRSSQETKIVIALPLPGVARLRIFTSNSAAMTTLTKAGFSQAVGLGMQSFGFTTMGLEDLAMLSPDTHLCLLDDDLPRELTESALWPVLPMVASNQMHTIGPDIWPFGSTRSMLRLLDRVESALSA
ncbi:iron-siderophore ABC transporter substrate-binding protein [Ochrobactrum pecoris]|uniref:Iron-siderophore ABC transporter substrate-binding protein n=1 Tax=Brucella pecoris TaxID=867683 RepID=A0A5C5CDJ1_9HYPH|nr:iron-siderophore ABC transporter substrate-binding protein [Brucella pecoris]TNV09025.1 iron-siderophore ABC transporter substrate-binding protein [Brucella pecoris]